MMKRRFNKRNLFFFCLAIVVALGMFACDLPTDPGPQPRDIIETTFEPGMNIFGVLRADGSPGSSFIRIEKAYKLPEVEAGAPYVVDNAVPVVIGEADSSITPFVFTEDSLQGKVYQSDTFVPVVETAYSLTITAPELDTLRGTTHIPPRPEIVPGTLVRSDGSIQFELAGQTGIYLYDLYLIAGEEMEHQRLAPVDSSALIVSFPVTFGEDTPAVLQLYGYDTNLAAYLTATITVKPQTYMEVLSTVDGGYGVFGSVSCRVIELPTSEE